MWGVGWTHMLDVQAPSYEGAAVVKRGFAGEYK